MSLHQEFHDSFQQPDDREVLLHDVDAVLVLLDHLHDLVEEASCFLEADERLLLLCVHESEER